MPNVELAKAREEAKKAANECSCSMALYKDGNEYYYLNAEEAITKKYPVFEVVTPDK